MPTWQEVLTHTVSDVEDHYDLLKYRLRERLGGRDPIQILPYRGYGTQDFLYLKGRVLEDKNIQSAVESDTVWDNLVNMYKRFNSKEIPYARVLARYQDVQQQVVADEEGFFEVNLEPSRPLSKDRLWHTIELELLKPLRDEDVSITAEGQVLVPPPDAEFGVISDIDDTVIYTDATHLIKMARTVFLGSARTRLPFKGVAAFYRALMHGQQQEGINPLFYVSSSPWNLYDLLVDFFRLQDIPLGQMLFLRDWGIKDEELLPITHWRYKINTIKKILDTYPDLPFILIGDNGQQDPEIYHEVVSTYPERTLAVYIRNVSQYLERPQKIHHLAENVLESGSVMILADETYTLAQHAAEQGWISPSALPKIKAEKERDEAPPTQIEALLDVAEGES
jgi:phosphatidate phosphatase APP1